MEDKTWLVLCGGEEVVTSTGRKANPNTTLYLKDPTIELLRELKTESFVVILVGECGLDKLFGLNSKRPDSKIQQFWTEVHRILATKGQFFLLGLEKAKDLFRIFKFLNSRFLLLQQLGDAQHVNHYRFLKVITLQPDIVTPEVINEALRTESRVEGLFNLGNRNKQICKLVEPSDGVKLGGGMYGQVYYLDAWRRDVVIKVVEDVGPDIKPDVIRFEGKIGPDGKRSAKDFLEIYASSLLNDLTTGESPFGFTMNIPRFAGFYTCLDTKFGRYDLYLIEEKEQMTLRTGLRGLKNEALFKTVLWQCLYTLIMINKLGWVHNDASTANFFVTKIDKSYYVNDVDISEAEEWIFRLDDKEWRLKHQKWVAKIGDFGMTHHFVKPLLAYFQADDQFDYRDRIVDKPRLGSDIGYFLFSIGFDLTYYDKKKALIPGVMKLYSDWLALLGVKVTAKDFFFQMANGPDKDFRVIGLLYNTGKLYERLENIDVSSLLDSSYFDDVISH